MLLSEMPMPCITTSKMYAAIFKSNNAFTTGGILIFSGFLMIKCNCASFMNLAVSVRFQTAKIPIFTR